MKRILKKTWQNPKRTGAKYFRDELTKHFASWHTNLNYIKFLVIISITIIFLNKSQLFVIFIFVSKMK